MANATKPPKGNYSRPANDFTGRKAEDLARQEAAALEEREHELTTASGLQHMEFEESDEIEDLTEGPNGVEVPEPELLDEDMVEVGDVNRIIRTNVDVETTIGYGNLYKFKAGRKYNVPSHVYVYLEERGLVYH